MILTFELDLDCTKLNRHAKYLGQRAFSSKTIVQTQTHTHSGPITLPGPLKRLVNMERVVKEIRQKDRIAAAHGRFSGIRQVALVCTLTEYVLPRAHRSPHPKGHLDRFSHFCTTYGRESLYFTMGRPFPP